MPELVQVIAGELVSQAETHASLDNIFMYAEASGEPPGGSKPVKAQEWLRETNKNHAEPLAVLGRIVHGYMEDPEMDPDFKLNEWETETEWKKAKRAHVRKFEAVLSRCGLRYQSGGFITTGGLAPSKKLADLIKGRDVPAIHREFDRALETVEAKPREAISAASNILSRSSKLISRTTVCRCRTNRTCNRYSRSCEPT